MRKKKHKEVKEAQAKAFTDKEIKKLAADDPEAVADLVAKGKMKILEEGQEVTLLKIEGDKALILPDRSDKAYWVPLDDIRTEP